MDYRLYAVPVDDAIEHIENPDDEGSLDKIKELAINVMLPEDNKNYGDRWPMNSLLELLLEVINYKTITDTYAKVKNTSCVYYLVDEINEIVIY